MPEAIDPAELRDRLSKIGGGQGSPDRSQLFEKLRQSTLTEAPSKEPGLWEGLKAGIKQGVTESGQEAGRSLAAAPMSLPGMRPNPAVQAAAASQERMGQSLAGEEKAGQEAFERSPEGQAPGSSVGRFLGNMAPAIAGGLAAGPSIAARGMALGTRIGGGMAAGGAGAAIQPTDPALDWESQKKQQVALGLGIGGAIPAAAGALAPAMPSMYQFEQSVNKVFPALGRFLTGAEERTPDGFQRAWLNQSLEPIGENVPRNMRAGHGLMQMALDKFNKAYDDIKPNLHFDLSNPQLMQQFDAGVQNIAGYLTPDVQGVFRHFLKNDVQTKFDANNMMDGEAYKQATSALSAASRKLYRTGKEELADAYDKVKDLMSGILKQQNPQDAPRLSNIDRGYSMLKHAVYGAAKPEADGKFSPSDILRSVSRSSSDNQMATQKSLGDGLAQGYAQLGRQILGGGKPRPGEIAHVLMGSIGEGLVPRMARAGAAATTRPAGRAMKAGAPGLSPAGGAAGAQAGPQFMPTPQPAQQDRPRQRLRVSQKIGELQSERYRANRRGDLAEVESLGKKLAEAHRDYRELGGTA